MIPLLALALVAPAAACGGPESDILDAPLVPIESRLEDWLYAGSYWGDAPADVTRFLHAFRPQAPALYAALDAALGTATPESATPTTPSTPTATPAAALPPGAPDTKAFHDALDRGDLDAANTAATAIVEAVLDLPAPLAEPYGDDLRLVVEFLELRPALAKAPKEAVAHWFSAVQVEPTGMPRALAPALAVRKGERDSNPKNPRAASIRWLALRDALRTGIPDGWSAEDIRTAAAAAPGGFDHFAGLQKQLDAWLHDYPDHPLADFVRLKKVRLAYLSGDADAAWSTLLEMYPRHPARVANELRFLTMQSVIPEKLDPKTPPEILVGVLDSHPLDDATWSAIWRATAAMPPAAALAIQERLLVGATEKDGALPEAFPSAPAAPSPAWAKLRLAALVRANRTADAEAQLPLLDPADPLVPPIAAQLRLAHGDWVGAIRTPGLDAATVRYFLRVLAPDEAVAAFLDDPDTTLRWEARLSTATRRLAKDGDWEKGAALLDPVDSGTAAAWREAGRLAKAGDPLAFARYVRKADLFQGTDHDEVVWYRSLPVTGPGTPARAGLPEGAEWAATQAWLKRSFTAWYALEAYARWLDALPAKPSTAQRAEAKQVLAEADKAYNALLNFGNGDYYAWGNVAKDSEPAKTIRRVGKALR